MLGEGGRGQRLIDAARGDLEAFIPHLLSPKRRTSDVLGLACFECHSQITTGNERHIVAHLNSLQAVAPV